MELYLLKTLLATTAGMPILKQLLVNCHNIYFNVQIHMKIKSKAKNLIQLFLKILIEILIIICCKLLQNGGIVKVDLATQILDFYFINFKIGIKICKKELFKI